MIDRDVIKAIDLIVDHCDRSATSDFKDHMGWRKRRTAERLPSLKHIMRAIGESIAYSQGSKSDLVGNLIDSGRLDEAMYGFDPHRLARANPKAVLRAHWSEIGCLRFKSKISLIIRAAQVLLGIDREAGSFGKYLGGYGIPRRIRSYDDLTDFWAGLGKLRADLRSRGMPFFNQTTSLLQLLMSLDFDAIKPDLIIMRLVRRIGMVERETGEGNLRDAVWSLQCYGVLRKVRPAALDWYLLSFGGQAEAGATLKRRFCSGPKKCRSRDCPVGLRGLCTDHVN